MARRPIPSLVTDLSGVLAYLKAIGVLPARLFRPGLLVRAVRSGFAIYWLGLLVHGR